MASGAFQTLPVGVVDLWPMDPLDVQETSTLRVPNNLVLSGPAMVRKYTPRAQLGPPLELALPGSHAEF